MILPWAKIPTHWIRDESDPKLKRFSRLNRGASISGLIIYIVMALRCNTKPNKVFRETGCTDLTYTELQRLTGLSRSLISAGLKMLIELGIIKSTSSGRRIFYQISNYDKVSGWAKVPNKHLYGNSTEDIRVFQDLKLRHDAELNALKLYLLLIAFRSEELNYAMISYDSITKYTAIQKNSIKSAQSLLTCWGLIQVDPETSPGVNKLNQPYKYRICGIDGRKHMGTQKRNANLLTED